MNRFQEALQRRLLPSFESLCQSYPPGSLSAVLIEHSGCLAKDEAIDLCPHKPPKTELGSYKAECVAYRRIDNKPPKFWTWRTCYRLSQDDDAWTQYVTLATEAGGCVKDWTTGHGISSDTIATHYDGFRWLYGLFDLAWAGHDQFPMHSERVYLLRDRLTDAALQKAFYESCYRVNTKKKRDAFIRKAKEVGIDIDPQNLPDLKSLAKWRREKLGRLDGEIGVVQSLGFWSVLADVARASLYAIDVLTGGTVADPRRTSPRKKPGRKPDTDPKKDKQIADAWKTGQYKTYEDCAEELGKTQREVKLAIDRDRKRKTPKRHRKKAT